MTTQGGKPAPESQGMDAFEHPFYLSLHVTIYWIAFGHPNAPSENRAVEAWDRAWAELHHALQAGIITAYALQSGQGEPVEIPRLFWAEAEIEPLEGYAWLQGQWRSHQEPPWQKIRFEREAVLSIWPEPLAGTEGQSADEAAAFPKAFSQAKVTEWYKKRVADWKDGNPIPSQDEDVKDAKAEISKKVTRAFVRDLRREHAPAAWNVTELGPKPKPSSK